MATASENLQDPEGLATAMKTDPVATAMMEATEIDEEMAIGSTSLPTLRPGGDQEPETIATLVKKVCIETGGDPHVTNIKGESFDILQTGSFPMLSLLPAKPTPSERGPFLHVDASISRTAKGCSEAYIQNATLSGTWITDMGYNLIEVRAKPSSLEVAIDGIWQNVSTITSVGFSSPSPQVLAIKIRKITIKIDILNYSNKRSSKYQAKVHKLGWSYLNMRFKGLYSLSSEFVDIRGLLGYDDHTSAATLPEICKKSAFARRTPTLPFLSSVSVN